MSILALTANTLAGSPGAGQVEYDGQFYATDSNASRGQLERLVQGTAVASTSGTSITFTGIPAWAKRITVMFNGVSTSGTSNMLIQVGSGSVTTTGYLGSGSWLSGSVATANYTTGFGIGTALATNSVVGILNIINLTSNTWIASGSLGNTTAATTGTVGGNITLSGALDRVVVTTVNGTDTFDAGSINIMYEG